MKVGAQLAATVLTLAVVGFGQPPRDRGTATIVDSGSTTIDCRAPPPSGPDRGTAGNERWDNFGSARQASLLRFGCGMAAHFAPCAALLEERLFWHTAHDRVRRPNDT